jgi:hypothetical protein
LYNENGVLVIGRKYFEKAAIIALCKGAIQKPFNIELPARYQSEGYQQLNTRGIQCDGKQLSISGPLGYEVFTK